MAGAAGLGLAGPSLAAPSPGALRADTSAAAPGNLPLGKLKGVADLTGRMIARVMVNGEGPFRFVVDTGANTSVISDDLATRLKLPIGRTAMVHGISGVQPAGTVNLRSLKSGFLDIPVRAVPVLKASDLGSDGILGIDAFVDRRIVLDMTNNEVTVEQSNKPWRELHMPTASITSEVTVEARQRFGQLTIIDVDAGSAPATCFIDTGAEVSVGNEALRRNLRPHPPRPDQHLPREVTIIGATGQQAMGALAIAPHVRLGGVRFNSLPLAFADLHTFDLWGLGSTPALMLGMDLLRLFEMVAVDFGRRQVTFRLALAEGPTFA